MKNRKQNIIIGVMIVALTLIIIGTTYAYFSGSGSTIESTSTLMATGGILEIRYDNKSGTIKLDDIYPREKEWVSKTFTVTGKNNTDLQMKYEIGLKTDNNTFTSGSLSYSLISENTSNNGEVVSSITNQVISDLSETSFGTGYFETGENLVHTYTLKIYFKDTGSNQNANQGAKYAGHITIKDSAFNKIELSKSNLSAIGYTDNEVPSNLVIPQTYMVGNEINQVTSIGDIAFGTGTGVDDYSPLPSLSNLTSLTLNEGLENIGMGAFAYATNLTGTLIMPSTLKTIGLGAFGGTGITGLTLNDGLESIGEKAFYYAENLTGTITMPSTVKTIGKNAFTKTGITGLILNEGLESIGEDAFAEDTNLTGTITIPSTVKSIGWRAFAATGITGLTLNEGLEVIGAGAFGEAQNLTGTIIMPSTVEYIGLLAFAATGITGLILNEGLETIAGYAFQLAENLTGTITIPSTVKLIANYAFDGTGITTINYPGTEEEWNKIEIGTDAFPSGVTINYNYTEQ